MQQILHFRRQYQYDQKDEEARIERLKNASSRYDDGSFGEGEDEGEQSFHNTLQFLCDFCSRRTIILILSPSSSSFHATTSFLFLIHHSSFIILHHPLILHEHQPQLTSHPLSSFVILHQHLPHSLSFLFLFDSISIRSSRIPPLSHFLSFLIHFDSSSSASAWFTPYFGADGM